MEVLTRKQARTNYYRLQTETRTNIQRGNARVNNSCIRKLNRLIQQKPDYWGVIYSGPRGVAFIRKWTLFLGGHAQQKILLNHWPNLLNGPYLRNWPNMTRHMRQVDLWKWSYYCPVTGNWMPLTRLGRDLTVAIFWKFQQKCGNSSQVAVRARSEHSSLPNLGSWAKKSNCPHHWTASHGKFSPSETASIILSNVFFSTIIFPAFAWRWFFIFSSDAPLANSGHCADSFGLPMILRVCWFFSEVLH